MQDDTKTREANVNAAFYAATRLVYARLGRRDEDAACEWDDALDDLWTGDAADDEERAGLLVEALAEYGAYLARRGADSLADARDDARVQMWAMVPDDAAAYALITRQLDAADALAAQHGASVQD